MKQQTRPLPLKAQLLLAVLICLPVVLLGFVPINPYPARLIQVLTRLRLAEAQQNHVEAAVQLRQVLVYQPQRLELLERIGRHEMAAGDYAQAAEYLDRAAQTGNISDGGLYRLGEARLKIGQPEAAMAAWRLLSEREQIDLGYYPQLIQHFRDHRDLTSGLAAAQRWLERDAHNPQARLMTGLFLSVQDAGQAIAVLTPLRNGSQEESRQAVLLLEPLEIMATHAQPAYGLVLVGQRLSELGYWDLAESALLSAVGASPEYAEAWAILGVVRQNLGEDGYPDLRRALELNPASDIVRTAVALYWRRQNQPLIAVSYLRLLAEKYPQQGRWQVELGATLAESGDLIEAMRAYQRAVEIEPENAAFWRALAIFSATKGFDPQAYTLPAAAQALALDGQNPETLDMAGFVYLNLGELEKAEQFLQQALQIDEENASANLHLGQVYIAMGRTSQAFQPLKHAANSADKAIALLAQRLLERYFSTAP
ncbi:MAG: tetratricopeptide repeat protein [Chloroflexota bacterium]